MSYLFILHLKIIRNRISRLTFLDEVKTALFLFIGLLFLAGIYLGAWRLLAYLNNVAIAGPLLVNKLMALVFLTSFAMVVFSSLVTSFTTIFFNKDITWLMATPLPVRSLFTFKALSTSFYSSWMVLVALAPFLIALGQVKHGSVWFYAGAVFLLLPFLVLASLTGITASLFLMRFLPSRRTRDIFLLLGILFITGLYILFRFLQPERLVKPDGLEVVAQYLAYLNAPTAVFLPSWWITAGAMGLLARNTREIVFYSGVLYGCAALGLIVVTALAERFYFIGWAEGQVYRRRRPPKNVSYLRRSPIRAMLEKDVAVFFRDANQWSQLLLLGALVLVYLFSIYKLPLDTMYLQNMVSFFNVGLTGFILAALALRFMFPLISLEGESLWLLRSAPLSMRQLLKEKFIYGSFPVVLLGVVLALASNGLLKTDWPVFLISLASVILMGFGLSGLALGFGALFPRFDLTNVAQIESSAGGLFYAVTSLFYLGLNIALLAVPVQNYYYYKFGGAYMEWRNLWWVAALAAILSVTAVGVPLWFGRRSLEALEK